MVLTAEKWGQVNYYWHFLMAVIVGLEEPRRSRIGENNMPRTSRMIIADEKAVYHVMSRTALDGFPLKDFENDFMLDLIKRFSSLYFTEILGICLMGNHFICWLK